MQLLSSRIGWEYCRTNVSTHIFSFLKRRWLDSSIALSFPGNLVPRLCVLAGGEIHLLLILYHHWACNYISLTVPALFWILVLPLQITLIDLHLGEHVFYKAYHFPHDILFYNLVARFSLSLPSYSAKFARWCRRSLKIEEYFAVLGYHELPTQDYTMNKTLFNPYYL